MRRQILELRTLAEASETLTSPLYLEQILRLLVEMAARVLEASAVHGDAARRRGTRARRRRTPRARGRVRGAPLRVGDGIPGEAAATGQPVVSADLAADPAVPHERAARPGARPVAARPCRCASGTTRSASSTATPRGGTRSRRPRSACCRRSRTKPRSRSRTPAWWSSRRWCARCTTG